MPEASGDADDTIGSLPDRPRRRGRAPPGGSSHHGQETPARRPGTARDHADCAEQGPAGVRQSGAAARLPDPLRGARVHLRVPADRAARLRPLHDRDRARPALRRAQEPEDVLLELPQRRRVPRKGDQHRARRPGACDRTAVRPHQRRLVRARRHPHPDRRRAPPARLEAGAGDRSRRPFDRRGPGPVSSALDARAATHWPAVLAAAACGVACAMNVGKVPPALPLLRSELGLTLVQAGWVSSALNTLAVVASFAFGLLTARVGAMPMVIGGLLLGAAASLAGLAAGGFASLVASRVVEGAGFMAVTVAGPGLIHVAAASAQRRFALGLWSAYMPAGAGLALALSPLLLPRSGWRGLWLASAAALLIAAALAWRQRRHYVAAVGGTHASQLAPALAVLRRLTPWWLALAFGAWAIQHFALIIGLLTCLMLFANVPGNLIGGALIQRGLPRGWLIAAAHLATGLCALGIFVDTWSDAVRYALCVALSFIGGLIPSSVMSSSVALARTPQQIGVLQGLLLQGAQLGQFLGSPLIAAVVAAAGSWTAARGVMAGAAAIGVALGVVVARDERRRSDAEGAR